MYGVDIGTGVSASALVVWGLQAGSYTLLVFAVMMAVVTLVLLARRLRRPAEYQRP